LVLRTLHLFAGAGGGILADMLLGHTPVCAVELEEYPRRVLLQRQLDGILPVFPIWDDVTTFSGYEWRGKVDVVSGGFPCQDISSAGKGAGITGARSGLWTHMARIIGEVRPRFVFVENSPLLVSRGLDTVLSDLAEMGFDAAWGVIGAHHAGAPHKRDRIWIMAHSESQCRRAGLCESGSKQDGSELTNCGCNVADANGAGFEKQRCAVADGEEHEASKCGGWWESEPDLGRVAHGVAARVDRLRAIGNGQVSCVAALAWEILNDGVTP